MQHLNMSLVPVLMDCVPLIASTMKWFLHLRNFKTELRHILQIVILPLLQLQYSAFTWCCFFPASEPIGNSMWVA